MIDLPNTQILVISYSEDRQVSFNDGMLLQNLVTTQSLGNKKKNRSKIAANTDFDARGTLALLARAKKFLKIDETYESDRESNLEQNDAKYGFPARYIAEKNEERFN